MAGNRSQTRLTTCSGDTFFFSFFDKQHNKWFVNQPQNTKFTHPRVERKENSEKYEAIFWFVIIVVVALSELVGGGGDGGDGIVGWGHRRCQGGEGFSS